MADLRGGSTVSGYPILHSGLSSAILNGALTVNGGLNLSGGQYYAQYYQGNQSQYRANWTSANNWGIGANGNSNTVQIGSVNTSGTFLNNGVTILILDGRMTSTQGISFGSSIDMSNQDFNSISGGSIWRGTNLANSPTSTSDWFHVLQMAHADSNWDCQIASNFFADQLYFRRKNSGTWQGWHKLLWDGTQFGAIQNLYSDKIQGYTGSNDRVSIGTGSCRFDTAGGEFRIYTSAYGSGSDYGIHMLPTGEIDFVHANTTSAWIGADGSVHGTSKSAFTDTLNYGRIITYCDESPDHVFNDRGRGTLDENGKCIIIFDPIYIETVNTSNGNYNVQLTGIRTSNIYIDDLQTDYFIVKGEPNADFFWEVTAQRYGWEGMRWNDADFEL